MVGVCSPLDAHQNLFGVFTDMPRTTALPSLYCLGFWGCASQSSTGFHDVLSLRCLGWSWERRDRVTEVITMLTVLTVPGRKGQITYP